jgi:hypothetical protein
VLRAKVSVYVDRYLANQQLRKLSGRVSAVEEAVAGLPAAAAPELADGLGRLQETIAALRGGDRTGAGRAGAGVSSAA